MLDMHLMIDAKEAGIRYCLNSASPGRLQCQQLVPRIHVRYMEYLETPGYCHLHRVIG